MFLHRRYALALPIVGRNQGEKINNVLSWWPKLLTATSSMPSVATEVKVDLYWPRNRCVLDVLVSRSLPLVS